MIFPLLLAALVAVAHCLGWQLARAVVRFLDSSKGKEVATQQADCSR